MQKICPQCGEEFVTPNITKMYCSGACIQKAQRKRSPVIRASAVRRAKKSSKRNRNKLAQISEGMKRLATCPCGRCDSDSDILLFHHRDPVTKCFSIAWAINHKISETRFWAEIEKCDIICQNYHTKLHKTEKRAGTTRVIKSPLLIPAYISTQKSIEKWRRNRGRTQE
jgi:hypothetical protein